MRTAYSHLQSSASLSPTLGLSLNQDAPTLILNNCADFTIPHNFHCEFRHMTYRTISTLLCYQMAQ